MVIKQNRTRIVRFMKIFLLTNTHLFFALKSLKPNPSGCVICASICKWLWRIGQANRKRRPHYNFDKFGLSAVNVVTGFGHKKSKIGFNLDRWGNLFKEFKEGGQLSIMCTQCGLRRGCIECQNVCIYGCRKPVNNHPHFIQMFSGY